MQYIVGFTTISTAAVCMTAIYKAHFNDFEHILSASVLGEEARVFQGWA